MSFTHGKKARLWVDAWELTSYFSEFQMSAKAGIAETTVFGLGAKTYIGGILEGQITGKGYFGSATTDTEDSTLSAALGRNGNMCVIFSPSGATAAGARAVITEAAETDLQISTPVAGVVATSMTAQADSGLSTGVILYDPTAAAITTATTTNGTGVNDTGVTDTPTTAVTIGSNGVNVSTFTGTQTLSATNPQATTPPFNASGGFLVVATSSGTAVLTYTGTTTTTFTGVTLVTGTGTLATAGAINSPYFSAQGLVCVANVLSTGAADTITINLQHSDDNATWVTLGSVGSITAPGGYYFVIAYGTVILRYLRAQIVTVGATISASLGIGAARQ